MGTYRFENFSVPAGCDAAACQAELEVLRQRYGQAISPKMLLKHATNPESAWHSLAHGKTDAVLAQAARIELMRRGMAALRYVDVKIEIRGSERREIEVSEILNYGGIKANDSGACGYVSVQAVRAKAELQAQVLSNQVEALRGHIRRLGIIIRDSPKMREAAQIGVLSLVHDLQKLVAE